jgi:hypothetical protein
MPMAPPAKFYKYMKADTAKKVTQNGTLQWSSPTLFNDPFDMQFDLHLAYDPDRVVNRVLNRLVDVYSGRAQPVAGSTIDEIAKVLRARVPRPKEADVRKEHRQGIYGIMKAMERGLPKLHDELRATLAPRKLLCLSEKPDNILMWAHYAENHTGTVIEFSYIEEGEYASTWGAAKPVRYMADMPRLANEEALVRSLIGQGRLATPEQFQDSVYVKADVWAYEKEWRVFGGWENDKEREYIPFRPKELTAVYLGCRMSEADRGEIKKTVAKKYPHAAVHDASKSSRRFALEFAKAA